jgi:hypothetical protein
MMCSYSFVMAGLVPAIREFRQSDRINRPNPGGQNEPDLPTPRPVLDVLFALDGGPNILVVSA